MHLAQPERQVQQVVERKRLPALQSQKHADHPKRHERRDEHGPHDDDRDRFRLRQDDGAENVAVNVPLSAAEPLLALVPHRILSDGQLSLAGREVPVNVGAMRDLWRVLMEVGDTEFVTVDGEDETVRIARVGDQITVQVEDRDEEGVETVDIQLPIVVVDALLAGDGDTLNVRAAVERLGELRGDIVRVSEDERQVRIWIDEVATQ